MPEFNMKFLGVYEGNEMVVGGPLPVYPCWLYHDKHEPRIVYNEDEEKQAKLEGFDHVNSTMMSNKTLVNWFWDFEDMSPKQLCVYSKEEYGVELPIEAGQKKLFQAVTELTRYAPQNKNRMVFMAHELPMKYEATLDEIRRMVDDPGEMNVERTYEEFTA